MRSAFVGLLAFVTPFAPAAGGEPASVIGHWPLAHDARDVSGHGRHAVHRGVRFEPADPDARSRSAARFDGRSASVDVPPDLAPELGARPFTIAAWIRLDDSGTDVPGCVVSQWDAGRRTGFQFGINHHAGVTTNQSNSRHVHFGIDQASPPPEWTNHGRLGDANLVFALAVHDGQLYAGTCEPRADGAGHVYRFEGGARWTDCGSPDRCNSVSALAVHDGQLYAGVARYRLAGSALPESENPHPGGAVYRYDGPSRWTDCGRPPGVDAIGGLAVFGNRLYASSLYRPAGFHRYVGGTEWESLQTPGGKRVEAMAVHNGELFASSYDLGHVFRFDGDRWFDCGQVGPEENTQTYSFAVHEGKLHVGTWRSGRVYRYEADDNWVDTGRLGNELEVMGMLVHNGVLYAGSLPLAEVYRYERGAGWIHSGRLDTTPDVVYRRAWTMAEYQGRLFCGTLPSGHVHSMQSGRCVTSDRPLDGGWHQIVGARTVDRLRLFIDGRLAAESESFDGASFDLNSGAPWTIGSGATDSFFGSICDVRLYDGELDADAVAALYRETALDIR